MSIAFHWYDRPQLVIVTLRDVINGDELLNAYASISRDPRYHELYHMLWDCRYISSFRIRKGDLGALKKMIDLRSPRERDALKRRVAILVPQQSIFSAASRFLSIAGKTSRQRRLFRTFAAAKSWLDAVLNDV